MNDKNENNNTNCCSHRYDIGISYYNLWYISNVKWTDYRKDGNDRIRDFVDNLGLLEINIKYFNILPNVKCKTLRKIYTKWKKKNICVSAIHEIKTE